MRGPSWRSLGVAVAVAGLLGMAASAGGQTTTGAIRGKVTVAEGDPVRGATIQITSPGLLGGRTTYSLDNGAYHFAAIPTGTYAIESTLAGFAPSRIENVTVGLGQTRDVDIKMTLPSVTQEIQVVAEPPQLDPTTNEQGGRVESEELIKVPTARDPWAVLNLIPSVQMDRINVGASESGQQALFVSKGDNGMGSVWNVDGVNITDQVAIGASSRYYDFGSIEEIQVTTGGTDAAHMTDGVGINIVTKRGSNDIKGSARAFFSNDSLQADNSPDPDELGASYSRSLTDSLFEFGGEVGFPIIKDRLWGWASGNRNKIDNNIVTTSIDGSQITQPDNTELINYGGKLNAQVVKNNEASFHYEFSDKRKQGRDASPTRLPETTFNQEGGSPLIKLEDQHIFGSNLILAAKYGDVGGGFSLTPQGGGAYDQGSTPTTSAYRDINLTWHGTFWSHSNDRPSRNLTLSGDYFATTGNVDHELKAGFSYRAAEVSDDTFWPGGTAYVEVASNGLSVVRFDQRLHSEESEQQVAFYAQDTLSFGKVTLNLGARFDRQQVKSKGGVQPAHPIFPDLMPEKQFAGADPPFTWSNVTPRVGLNYELDDKTVAKASYAKYVENLTLGFAIQANPAYSTTYSYAYGFDANHDGQITQSEFLTPLYGPYGPDPNAAEFGNRIDPDLASPKTHEVVLSLDRQLAPDLVVSISGTWREGYDGVWRLPLVHEGSGADRVATRADFEEVGAVAGTYTQDEELFTYSEPYYRLRPGVRFSQRHLFENRPDYKEHFLGGELSVNKRFSNHWLLGGSVAVSDWRMKFDPSGDGAYPDPTRDLDNPYPETGEGQIAARSGGGTKGNVFMNASWQSSLRAAYTIEAGPGSIELGTNLTLRQGYPIPVVDSSGRSALGAGARTILVSEVDQLRHGNPFIADFRLAYTPSFGRVGLELGVDVFNAFNSDIVLQQRREANLRVSGTAIPIFGSPTEVVGPRMFRFGARVTF